MHPVLWIGAIALIALGILLLIVGVRFLLRARKENEAKAEQRGAAKADAIMGIRQPPVAADKTQVMPVVSAAPLSPQRTSVKDVPVPERNPMTTPPPPSPVVPAPVPAPEVVAQAVIPEPTPVVPAPAPAASVAKPAAEAADFVDSRYPALYAFADDIAKLRNDRQTQARLVNNISRDVNSLGEYF